MRTGYFVRLMLFAALLGLLSGSASNQVNRLDSCRYNFAAAHRAYELGDYAKALNTFRSLSSQYEELGDYALFYWASSAMKLDYPASTLKACDRLLKEHPQSRLTEDTRELRMFALIDLGRYREAHEEARKALDEMDAPGDSQLLYIAARSKEGMGRYNEAADEYLLITALFKGNRWHDLSKQRLEALQSEREISAPRLTDEQVIQVARSHFGRNHPRTAGGYGKLLLDRGVKGDLAAEAQVYYANRLKKSRRRKDRNKALELFNEVISDSPKREQWVAAALYLSADILDADDEFARKRQVLEDYPETEWAAWAAYDLGNRNWFAHNFDTAAKQLLFCAYGFEDFDKRRAALWRGGFAAYMSGEYDDAIKALELSAELETDSEDIQRALFWRARCLEEKGEEAPAAEGYYGVLGLGPDEYYGLLSRERMRRMNVPPLLSARTYIGRTALNTVHAAVGEAIPFPIEAASDQLVNMAAKNADAYASYHLVKVREFYVMDLDDFAALEVQALRRARNYGSPIAAARLSQALWREDERLLSLLAANYAHRHAGMKGMQDPYRLFARLRLPKPYYEAVKIKADDFGIDPYLIMALIRQESAFQHWVTSRAGARGLMQVMPSTGRYIARKRGLADGFDKNMLHDPDVSIDFGCWYMRYLLRQLNGDYVQSIAGYNGGPGNAKKWWPTFIGMETAEAVEVIPLTETRNYVKYVTRNWTLYRGLYLSQDPNPPIRQMLEIIN